jgi:hypothetical protein
MVYIYIYAGTVMGSGSHLTQKTGFNVVEKSSDAKFCICIASVDVWLKELKEKKISG